MLGKMAANVHKGDWHDVDEDFLNGRLMDELKEYEESKKPSAKVLELADVANICMMLADKVMVNSSGNDRR